MGNFGTEKGTKVGHRLKCYDDEEFGRGFEVTKSSFSLPNINQCMVVSKIRRDLLCPLKVNKSI